MNVGRLTLDCVAFSFGMTRPRTRGTTQMRVGAAPQILIRGQSQERPVSTSRQIRRANRHSNDAWNTSVAGACANEETWSHVKANG